MNWYKKAQEDPKIGEIFSLNQFEDMMQRAYNLNSEYLMEEAIDGKEIDPPIRTWREWIQRQKSEDISLSIESDHTLYSLFLQALPEGVTAGDLIDAYKNNELKYKSQDYSSYKRSDLKDISETEEGESLPWSKKKPQQLDDKEIINIFKTATLRLTQSNKKEITEARKSLFTLYGCDKKLYEKLGISSSELNKKMKSLTGITASSIDLERQLNANVPDEHQWMGITNTSFFGKMRVDHKDLDKFVKNIDVSKEGEVFYHGDKGEELRKYIAMSFLGIDTKISYDDLSFEIGECRNLSGKKVGGMYHNNLKKISVSSLSQNTVSHEIGHYLDYKWADQFFKSSQPLSLMTLRGANMTLLKNRVPIQQMEWFKKYSTFIKNLMSKGDIVSEYTQRASEVFARFVDKFIRWTISKGNKNHYYGEEDSYSDKFTEKDYRDFVMMLQEKSWLDKNYPISEEKL